MQKESAVVSYLRHYAWEDVNHFCHRRTIRRVIEAVRRRDVNRVRQILNNCKNEQVIRSAICSAVSDTSMLQSILDQVKHSNVSDNLYKRKHCRYNISPLHFACMLGEEESVLLLLKAGFTANVFDTRNITPLYWALFTKHWSIADVLLSIDDIDVNSGITPLQLVCREGYIDSARTLLSCGADVNERGGYDWTPLFEACSNGYTDIVELLLQSGAKINQDDDIRFMSKHYRWYKFPLLAAIQFRYPEMVSLLISHGVKINNMIISHEGTYLHVACSKGTLGMVKTLVNNGSCINVVTQSGKTPLFHCLRSCYVRGGVVPRYTGILSHSDQNLQKSFEESIQEGNAIMEYLIQKGATLSCKDERGKTPLGYAMITYMTFSTFILLKYGGRISGKYVDKFLKSLRSRGGLRQDHIPNVHLFRLLWKSNFEFRKLIPVYLEKIRDLKSTESILSFLKEVEQPLSLKDQCRISIRNVISTDTGVQFISSINTLGLPKLLQGFLMFDDFDQCKGLPLFLHSNSS